VAIDLKMRDSVPVRDDSRVEMKTDGMIGERYIDILPGMGSPLPPNSTLIGSPGGLDGLFEAFAATGGDLEGLLVAVQRLLTDESYANSLPSILASLQQLLTALPPYLPALMATVETLTEQIQQDVASTSQSLKTLLGQLDETVAENRDGFKLLVRDLNATLHDTRQALNTTQSLLTKSQTRIPQALDSLQTLITSVQESSHQLTDRLDQLVANMDSVVTHNDRNLYETIENLRHMTEDLEATAKLVRNNPAVVIWGRKGRRNQREPSQPIQTLQDRGRIGRYDRVR
jgi:ABC-type transporter Mla subunit MlaD